MTEIPIPGAGKTYTTPGVRTFGIMIVITLQVILAIVSFGLGGLILISYQFDYIEYTIGSIALIFVGILFIFACFGLWNMQPWSWIVTVLANIIQIGGYIAFMIFTAMPPIFGIGQIIISVLIFLYFLMPTTRSHLM